MERKKQQIRRGAFPEEPGTRPSASSPSPTRSGKRESFRQPPEVTDAPRVSTARARTRLPRIPREDIEPVAPMFTVEDDPARTPRPVTGGIALESVPRLVRRPQSLVDLPLDHKSGFVLSMIDGETTVQTLIDVSGMPPLEVVTKLEELVSLGVVLLG